MEIVVIVQDVQDQPPVFTLAPPVTKLPPGILPGDKVIIANSYVVTRVLFKVFIFFEDIASSCGRWRQRKSA